MDYHTPRYPYRLYVTGTDTFNNYFLFRHYLNEYMTNKTFLYSPKASTFDTMSKLYATANNLCYMTCNTAKGLEQYHNAAAINSIISNTADMLVAFWDGKSDGIKDLEYAFKSRRKKVVFIDITDNDNITTDIKLSVPYTTKATFKEVYGKTKFYYTEFPTNSCSELAMKFLADAYTDKNFMKLIIDNRTTDYIVNDKFDEALKALLTWIYNNQFEELKNDYKNMIEKEDPPKFKRFSPNEYRHAPECEWKEEGEEVGVYTGTGLPLSTGYNTVIEYGSHKFVEIKDTQMLKAHIHKSLKARAFTEEEDNCIKVTYHTSDTESYPITYQVANFENSKFKMGYWYINTDFVTTIKPQPRKEVTLDE